MGHCNPADAAVFSSGGMVWPRHGASDDGFSRGALGVLGPRGSLINWRLRGGPNSSGDNRDDDDDDDDDDEDLEEDEDDVSDDDDEGERWRRRPRISTTYELLNYVPFYEQLQRDGAGANSKSTP
jgi:hypothetical protein